ncbi:transketolase C-terminal domain-containing protein [Shumkonia mesophila]|uniref:transketolase C-terminal domain-containing protein n=1 Tax=Shumkonia mesophila TaxID=2838854 RepID=UPI00293477A6|nr:transketolase C-terminal domain-containing protein [Shumkonia mesophila]
MSSKTRLDHLLVERGLAESRTRAQALVMAGLVYSQERRLAKPFDRDLVRRLAREHEVLITIEEGATGGFGSHVTHFLAGEGLLDGGLKFRTMTMPDSFLEQDTVPNQYEKAGLTARHIVGVALTALGRANEAAAARRA